MDRDESGLRVGDHKELMVRAGARGWVVNNIDYTVVDGMELSCKDGRGVAVPVRKDLVINRVGKLIYSVVLFGAIRIVESHVAETV